jgi:uncharacterized protein DUF4406
MKKKVYVAGPYTKGDVAVNVRRAIEVGTELFDLGYIPFIPHLTHFWHLVTPKPYETWLDIDNEWLPTCDALLRIPGESSGADKEVALAHKLGIPVYFDIIALSAAIATQ